MEGPRNHRGKARPDFASLIEKDRMLFKHEEKKVCLERNHQITIVKAKKKVQLLHTLFKHNQMEAEMAFLMHLIDALDYSMIVYSRFGDL